MLNELIDKGLLTPDDKIRALRRSKSVGNSFFNKYVDYSLCNVFLEAFQKDKHFCEQLKIAVADEKITKCFRNGDVMIEQFNHFLGAEVPNFTWNKNFKKASELLLDSVGRVKLHPLHYENSEDLLNSFSNKHSSAGILFEGTKEDNYEEIFNKFLHLKHLISADGGVKIPALAFHRAQISNFVKDGVVDSSEIKYKDRLVWCIDAATVSVESQFAKPLIDHFSRNVNWYAGGKDPLTLRKLIRSGYNTVGQWYSLDFSLFDQTIPSWLLKHCFYLIREMLVLTEEEDAELRWVEDNFINTSILLDNESIRQKAKGIPSGSNFTQLIGSMANFLVIMTYLFHDLSDSNKVYETKVWENLGGSRTTLKCFIMGDDNLFFSYKKISVEDLSSYVWNNFGMKIHPEKTESSGSERIEPKFLKRQWKEFGEYRDALTMAVNVVHPERPRNYEGYCAWHILYGLFVTFEYSFRGYVLEGDIVERMQQHGQLQTLETLSPRDLPGSLRVFGDKGPAMLYRRAKAMLGDS